MFPASRGMFKKDVAAWSEADRQGSWTGTGVAPGGADVSSGFEYETNFQSRPESLKVATSYPDNSNFGRHVFRSGDALSQSISQRKSTLMVSGSLPGAILVISRR